MAVADVPLYMAVQPQAVSGVPAVYSKFSTNNTSACAADSVSAVRHKSITVLLMVLILL